MSTDTKTPTKLDLACGQNKREGFFGIDIAEAEGVDMVYDLTRFPWPIDDSSVEEIVSSHYVEHTYQGTPERLDGLVAFMNELHRICKPDAKVEIIHPYALSKRAFQDPTHTRFIHEDTWPYFNREWREAQRLDHYPITANFAVEGISNGFYPEWALRSDVSRTWAAAHYWDVVTDLVVTLRALKD